MLIPDRQCDSIASRPIRDGEELIIPLDRPAMADVIPQANVVRIEARSGGQYWVARIGPPLLGIESVGVSPLHAAAALLLECEALGWCFDETWRDAT